MSNKDLKFRNNLVKANLFDTNFNADKMASRRIERTLHIKLKNNAEELSKAYEYRNKAMKKQATARIDPRHL